MRSAERIARALATTASGWLAVGATLTSCTGVEQAPVPPARSALAEIQANDNRRPSGVERDGSLTLQLEIGEGQWRPELAQPAYRILAFGEPGQPLVTPGPTVRVREGMLIDADFMIAPGEIYDFALDAKESGELRLEVVLDHEARIEASTRLILRPAR